MFTADEHALAHANDPYYHYKEAAHSDEFSTCSQSSIVIQPNIQIHGTPIMLK